MSKEGTWSITYLIKELSKKSKLDQIVLNIKMLERDKLLIFDHFCLICG